MVTILDVAQRARVSPATVSRVLNHSSHAVSEEVRRRVIVAARRLGYFPNLLARSLLKRETSAIGVLVPDVSNPYYAVILRGIEDAAGTSGRAVVVCNTDRRRDKLQSYLRALLERRVDGLIIAGGTVHVSDLKAIRALPPAVAVGRHPVRLPSVRVDNVQAAATATQHLLALGHRRIGFLAGPPTSWTARDRLDGYRRALRRAGLTPRARDVAVGEFSLAGGLAGTVRLLGSPHRPTAIVASSDQMAIGALRALHDRGLRVPEDVSVVGFDDSPLAPYVVPAITSVAIPMYEIGRQALLLLLRLIEEGRSSSLVLPTELQVRESTAPPPGMESRARAGRPVLLVSRGDG